MLLLMFHEVNKKTELKFLCRFTLVLAIQIEKSFEILKLTESLRDNTV